MADEVDLNINLRSGETATGDSGRTTVADPADTFRENQEDLERELSLLRQAVVDLTGAIGNLPGGGTSDTGAPQPSTFPGVDTGGGGGGAGAAGAAGRAGMLGRAAAALGPVGVAVGAGAAGVGAAVAFDRRLTQTFDALITRIAPFSDEVLQALTEEEIARFRDDQALAEELGPQAARILRRRTANLAATRPARVAAFEGLLAEQITARTLVGSIDLLNQSVKELNETIKNLRNKDIQRDVLDPLRRALEDEGVLKPQEDIQIPMRPREQQPFDTELLGP